MTLFTVTTNTELFYVYAIDASHAEGIVYSEHFPELLDDELADFFQVDVVTKPGIIISVDSPRCFKKSWEEVRQK